ncbi:hypothetical protein B0T25DRAFT_592374 [Lasiosphaeria hispida]|uniref:Uncharacterized protein n=1 Tax=Lasiosphaeria hispida TaxID=260671 RepID=A0AAJ0HAJ6_9PEZI|nr:hypothetical protein B0T25DRAFT_592374 [Lasiosphaeria hispida]
MELPRDNCLGSFQDLLQLLEDLDENSSREPLAGMAFSVSPAQYLTLLQMEFRGNPGPSDYSCRILYYKKKTTHIHRRLVVVICCDIHYARGVDRAKKTAEAPERSAISMWVKDKDGNVQTVMIYSRGVLRKACEEQLAADIIDATKPRKPRQPKAKSQEREEELRRKKRKWIKSISVSNSSCAAKIGSCGD